MRALNIAATGMQAQELHVEVISHNLANMTTTGYKMMRPEFQDLLYQNYRRVGTNSTDAETVVPTGIQVGLGVKTGATYRIHTQGNVNQTENPLDLAVKGKGFFRIELPSGDFAYTRDGTFQLSPEGELVTADGYLVSPGIVVPEGAKNVSINRSGEVEVSIEGQVEPQNVGQIELVTFINEAGLDAQGDNLYLETIASGEPIVGVAGEEDVGTLLQGFLETANVNPITEISSLIMAQRAYEMNSKIITAGDEMMRALNQS